MYIKQAHRTGMKLIKRLTQGLIVLLLLVFIIVFAFLYQLDIERYRNDFNSEISMMLGHKAEIKGDLSWKWWPYLGIYATEIIIYNQDNDVLSTIEKIKAHIQYQPLSKGKLHIHLLEILNTTVNLPWPQRSFKGSKELTLKKIKREQLNLEKKISIRAINFRNIYFIDRGVTIHIDKLQAIDITPNKPFPIFIGLHLNESPRYRQSHVSVIRLYDGKIKGMASLPEGFMKQPLIEKIHSFQMNAEVIAPQLRLLKVYGQDLSSKLKIKDGVLKASNIHFNAGSGVINAELYFKLLDRRGEIKLKARNLNTEALLAHRIPLMFNGTVDIVGKFSGKFGSQQNLVKTIKGYFYLEFISGVFKAFSPQLAIKNTEELIREFNIIDKKALTRLLAKIDTRDLSSRNDLAIDNARVEMNFTPGLAKISNLTVISPPYVLEFSLDLSLTTTAYNGSGTLSIMPEKLKTLPADLAPLKGKIPLLLNGVVGYPELRLDTAKIVDQLKPKK